MAVKVFVSLLLRKHLVRRKLILLKTLGFLDFLGLSCTGLLAMFWSIVRVQYSKTLQMSLQRIIFYDSQDISRPIAGKQLSWKRFASWRTLGFLDFLDTIWQKINHKLCIICNAIWSPAGIAKVGFCMISSESRIFYHS